MRNVLRDLEIRVAKLEKKSSWTDYFKRFPKIRVQATKISKMIEVLFKGQGFDIKLSNPVKTEVIEFGEKMVVLNYSFELEDNTYILEISAGKPSLYDEIMAYDESFNVQNIPLRLVFKNIRKKMYSYSTDINGTAEFKSKARRIIKTFMDIK